MHDGMHATSSPRFASMPHATEAGVRDAARALVNHRKHVSRLNAVPQAADVGVGTVYRHFPTPEALTEALAADQFAVLVRTAAAAAPTQQGLRNFLKAALTVYLRDDAFAAAITDPNPVTTDSQHLRDGCNTGFATVSLVEGSRRVDA